jgi:hypothetical protein
MLPTGRFRRITYMTYFIYRNAASAVSVSSISCKLARSSVLPTLIGAKQSITNIHTYIHGSRQLKEHSG